MLYWNPVGQRLPRQFIAIAAVVLSSLVSVRHCIGRTPADEARSPAVDSADSVVDFGREIAPILRERCLGCHAEKASGGLRLETRERLQKGGDSGPAVLAGDASASLLWQRVSADQDSAEKMPPDGSRLTPRQVTALQRWIDQGANWPKEQVLSSPQAAAARHWAYQRVRRSDPPARPDTGWARNEIDCFVAASLADLAMTPAPEADPLTLLRRVTLDLTGLPPSPADLDGFLADRATGAYERAVDRLLMSPAYGERWARPWLDLCHFADTDGYLTDQLRPVAWRYRQWLIQALNEDLPFDQMTLWQLAGDLLPDATPQQLLATGFLRNTLSNREGGADLEEYRVEQIIDRTTLVGIGWLGLTIGCARCHDHKYDPVTQEDFFRLYGFLDQTDEVNIDAPLPGEQAEFASGYAEYRRKRDELLVPVGGELQALQAAWEKRLLHAAAHPAEDPIWDRQWEVLGLVWGGGLGEGQLEGCVIVQTPVTARTQDEADRLQDYFLASGSLTDEAAFARLRLSELRSQLIALRQGVRWPTRAPVIRQARFPRPVHVHVRGDFRVPAQRVSPEIFRWLTATAETAVSERNSGAEGASSAGCGDPSIPGIPNGSQPTRVDLARWLLAPENPLTSRVAVNRMWQEFFGRGLVDPGTDFGLRGQPPSHPQLLDWLASEFITRGWSVKHMHRLIVTSAVYRQSSRAEPALIRRDPQNRLLARQLPLRFSADQVRDAALSVSGLLDRRIGGPSVFPPQPESVSKEGYSNVWKNSEGADRYRRSVYTWLQRLSPYAQNVTFDAPPANSLCTVRSRTNSPLQALTLLNDPVFFEAARHLAQNMLRERCDDDRARISALIRRALSRTPTSEEQVILLAFLEGQRTLLKDDPKETARLTTVPLLSENSADSGAPALPASSAESAAESAAGSAAGAVQAETTLIPLAAPDADQIELAAWTSLCSVVLNLHEFITRD